MRTRTPRNLLVRSLMVLGALCLAAPALADVANEETEPESEETCTIADECPDSGKLCEFSSNTTCDDAAKDAGLEQRCEAASGVVYCDPDETAGCATAIRPRQPGLSFALAAFGAAAVATFVRARRRARR